VLAQALVLALERILGLHQVVSLLGDRSQPLRQRLLLRQKPVAFLLELIALLTELRAGVLELVAPRRGGAEVSLEALPGFAQAISFFARRAQLLFELGLGPQKAIALFAHGAQQLFQALLDLQQPVAFRTRGVELALELGPALQELVAL